MEEYQTNMGVECTPEENKAINALRRALEKWRKATKKGRLYLYATPDGVNVMMYEDETNPHPDNNSYGGVNVDNQVTLIPLPIECGDW